MNKCTPLWPLHPSLWLAQLTVCLTGANAERFDEHLPFLLLLSFCFSASLLAEPRVVVFEGGVWPDLLEPHDPHEQSPSAILLAHRLEIAAAYPEVRTDHTRHIPGEVSKTKEGILLKNRIAGSSEGGRRGVCVYVRGLIGVWRRRLEDWSVRVSTHLRQWRFTISSATML